LRQPLLLSPLQRLEEQTDSRAMTATATTASLIVVSFRQFLTFTHQDEFQGFTVKGAGPGTIVVVSAQYCGPSASLPENSLKFNFQI